MLIRQTAPVLGAASPYQQAGEWQFNVSLRQLRSDTHYRLDQRQLEREELGTFVINRQHAADLTASYAFTERRSVSVGVPFSVASWSIPSPTGPVPGPRAQQDARGLGDITAMGRMWLLDTRSHTTGNVAVGLGVKVPTGNYDVQDMYPDRNGQNNQLRYVDQSIQPGDGGWGLMLEAQGFKRLGRAQVFGSGSYLANPRDTNGTPSLTVARLPPGASPPANSDRLVNSVPDQYVARVGAAVRARGRLGLSAAYRVEGQRRYDLIGKSHGFRRPGVAMFVEPGISYSKGVQSFSINVPIAFYRNRKPDPYTGLQGDATFPRFIMLANYGYRFGGVRKTTPATRTEADTPDSSAPWLTLPQCTANATEKPGGGQ
ncbi:MAG: hypothetical protein M3295_04525 [Chloroflexota bacterium]|nr:hypothetical protein [Chloroflexota bacterium]